MPFVAAADGTQLYAEAHGGGEPIVFSPGYVQTHENFRAQVEPFVAAGHRVVLWDYRGHGRSQAPEAASAYSIAHVVSDLGRVLDWAAPGQRAICAGLSFGGLASQHFALAHPERVSRARADRHGPGLQEARGAARAGSRKSSASPPASRRTGSRVTRADRRSRSASASPPSCRQRRPLGARSRRNRRAGWRAFGRNVSGPAPATLDRLAELAAPTLVLVGALDTAYLRAAEVMTARIPGAKNVTIPNAGHCVNIEQAEAFNRAVLGFLAARG